MGIEIERKFLVDFSLLPCLKHIDSKLIKQGYLSSEPTIRIRLIDEYKAEINIKSKGLLKRLEFEYVIPYEDGIELYNMTNSKLEKRRYYISDDKKEWEVDEYFGIHKGLWTAEIELTSEDEEFNRPAWVTKEVTYDSSYSNVSLARKGKEI